jgi:hypothetical protein
MIRQYILYIAVLLNALPIKMDTIEKLLDNSSYDRRIRPNFKENTPTIIKISLHINSISGVSEVNMVI